MQPRASMVLASLARNYRDFATRCGQRYIRTLLADLVLLSPSDSQHDHSCTRWRMDREKDLSA